MPVSVPVPVPGPNERTDGGHGHGHGHAIDQIGEAKPVLEPEGYREYPAAAGTLRWPRSCQQAVSIYCDRHLDRRGGSELPAYYEHVGRWRLGMRGFRSRWVRTARGRMHLFDALGQGSLPTAVALHGLSSSATPLSPVLTRLRPHFRRIIAPDAPAHGFSEVPHDLDPEILYEGIAELLDAELDEPAIFFGNSMGGAVALRYAVERPEKVAALVVCSPAGARTDPASVQPWLDRFRMSDMTQARSFVNDLYVRPPWYIGMVARECRKLFHREPIQSLLNAVDPERHLTADELASLEMPVLFIWGGEERTMLGEHLDFFKAHLPPHVEMVEPAHFTHCPYLEHPGEVASMITEFARRHAPNRLPAP